MGYDIPQPVSQGIDGAQDQENRRIAEIADELRRRCQLHEAELRNGETNVIPRNVLADKDGDLFVVDAEIRKA